MDYKRTERKPAPGRAIANKLDWVSSKYPHWMLYAFYCWHYVQRSTMCLKKGPNFETV